MSVVIADLSSSKKSTGITLDLNRTILTLAASWTGTPTGTLGLEVSNDTTDGVNGLWIPYSGITVPTQPSGAPGSIGLELIDWGWLAYRWSWTFVSGAGALSATQNQR